MNGNKFNAFNAFKAFNEHINSYTVQVKQGIHNGEIVEYCKTFKRKQRIGGILYNI